MSNRILIIEDNLALADSLRDILSIENYSVSCVNSGRDGLAAALSTKPDLIILDIKMPDMDGYQVFQALRQDVWGKQAKVLILTASESIENISKNVDLPKKYVLFKPDVSVQDLRTAVTERLAE